MTAQHGIKITEASQAQAIATSIEVIVRDLPSMPEMARALLKAFALKLPPTFAITTLLAHDFKKVLRLTDEDAFDRNLYEAVQAQRWSAS